MASAPSATRDVATVTVRIQLPEQALTTSVSLAKVYSVKDLVVHIMLYAKQQKALSAVQMSLLACLVYKQAQEVGGKAQRLRATNVLVDEGVKNGDTLLVKFIARSLLK